MSALVVIEDRPGTASSPPASWTWSEAAFHLAATPGPFLGLHIGPRIVCLLEGTLHACPGVGEVARTDSAEEAAGRLASAYARAGRGIFGRLRGEYWALLWDRERAQGVVVSDHLGTCPPYFAHQAGALRLASELPELLDALPSTPAPDPIALAHWLMRTLPPAEHTMYTGVERLPAAHLLSLGEGRTRPRRYWEPRYRPPRALDTGEVRAALELAVARRLAAGATPGVLLSGGLDSSAVAALSAETRPGIATYSAAFPEYPDVDESALIDRTVARLGLSNTRLLVRDAQVLAGAAEFIAAWRSPPASPNLFFWIPLMRRAGGDGVRVMLDGEGGDEVFGFSPDLIADRLRGGHLADALRLAARWPGARARAPRHVVVARLRSAGLRAAMPAGAHRAMRAVRSLDTYAPAWLPRTLAREWLETERGPFAYKRPGLPRWWSYLVETITRGHGPSIVYEQTRRRAAMGGVRASHPLVDVDLVELVLSGDPRPAFGAPLNRPLLRDALAGRLDDAVRLRRGKSFFDAVFQAALGGSDFAALRALLDPRDAELGAYVDIATLNGELFSQSADLHPEGLMGWTLVAWRAVTAELWLRQQANRPFHAPSGPEARFEVTHTGNLTNAVDGP